MAKMKLVSTSALSDRYARFLYFLFRALVFVANGLLTSNGFYFSYVYERRSCLGVIVSVLRPV